jgi:hypothetical protein
MRCSVRTMFGTDAKVIDSKLAPCRRCGVIVMWSRCVTSFGDGWTTDVHDACDGEAFICAKPALVSFTFTYQLSGRLEEGG